MKKNYGIDMQGPFRVQRVASLPGWTSDDLGREVYLTSNNRRYYGNNSAWVESDVDKIWTHQDTAPTGWSIISGTTDALLATKGGSNAYNVSGGTQAGTWTQPNHTHTVDNHIHATGAHTLTIAEMPAHNHYGVPQRTSNSDRGTSSSTWNLDGSSFPTDNTGGGGSHNHGNTGSNGPGSTNAGATAATYRPDANVGIVIERN